MAATRRTITVWSFRAGRRQRFWRKVTTSRRRRMRIAGPSRPIVEDYIGPAHIETYSVPFERHGKPSFATIIGRTPAGARVIAHVAQDNEMVLQHLTSTQIEAVGTPGRVLALADGRRGWMAAEE
jgi:hypothetical protein